MKHPMFILVLVLILTSTMQGSMMQKIVFENPALFTKSNGYDIIKVKGADLTATPGFPQLPVITKHYVIPENAIVTGIEIISEQKEDVSGKFDVYPVQKPAILSTPFMKFEPGPWIPKNPRIYSSNKPFPQKCIEVGASGNMSGYRIISLNFYPYSYIPLEGKLERIKEVTFRINYEMGQKAQRITRISNLGRKILRKSVVSLCENPEVIYDPFDGADSDSTIDYVIITSSAFASYFQPLCDWKTQKGIKAKIVTTDSIYANCPGSDNQEKIRNFIKDAHTNWGTIWILLGGDTGIIPARVAFAMACEAGYQPEDEDSIRADLYYSDLDGNWNFNGTPPYGEIADSVDLYPDVFVGRVPANSTTNVTTFVNKILTYEVNPPCDYELNILFFAMILWWDPYTDSGLGKDLIDSLYIPSRFNITKLYESWGNENKANVIAAINAGQNLLNHNGHAWYTVMSTGPDGLYRNDMDNLSNGNRQGIIYSIGCWSSAIDYDAISEHYVNNPNGGGVAFIGNSRYGWGSPGNPCYGYSDRFDANFYNTLLVRDLTHIGYTLAMNKVDFIPRSRAENVYRWHQYQLNLLGDPEMPIWTDTPSVLSVFHPDTLQNGMEVTVTVRNFGREPVKNALVCLLKGTELYERGYTNVLGEFKATVTITTPGMTTLTVTGENFLPFIDSLYTKLQGPYLAYQSHFIEDNISGNNDGLLNPGESSYFFTNVKNYGTQVVTNPTIRLSSDDSFVSMIDSVHTITGTVEPESTTLCTFAITVASNTENGDVAKLRIDATSAQGSWQSWTNEMIAKPVLSVEFDSLFDENNNGIPEPGENISLYYSMKNWGYGYGYNVNCSFTETDPYITLTAGTNPSWPTVSPEGSETGTLSSVISNSCPDPYFASVSYYITTTEGFAFPGSLLVSIGHLGFSDDMESGTAKWSHSGSLDDWHLSTYRKHAGNYSWYCGLESTHKYQSNSDGQLLSVPFKVGPKTHLGFWHWYEFTNYGSDGLHIIVKRQSSQDTLDYIGSGGALDSMLFIGNDWLPEDYDLSYLPPGEEIQLLFSFTSDDADTAAGIYIDDVNIEGDKITEKKELELYVPQFKNNLLVFPNITKSVANIYCSVETNAKMSIGIYDVCGRKVKTLLSGKRSEGDIRIIWNGRDDKGYKVPQGIYFVRMEIPTKGFVDNEKVVFLR